VQDFAEGLDLRQTCFRRPREQAQFRARGNTAFENGVRNFLHIDSVPFEHGEDVPTLSIIRMTMRKRAAEDTSTLTTLGTVASSRNERMMRTVSVAMASCAWSVAAAMCGVP
jgi:hypothetical protein